MKQIILLILIFSIYYITTSCEKIQPPYKQAIVPNDTDSDTDAVYIQKVLIEDFTGFKCGNCPKAHDAIEELKAMYPGKIVSYAIHSGSFAKPNTAGTKYRYDFRTPLGSELTRIFNPDSSWYPSGLINRIKINDSWIQLYPTWSSIIDTILNRKPKIEIEIENKYDTTARTLTTTVKSDILISMNNTLRLCVYLTEDSIIKWQTDYRLNPYPDVENYVHRHALRGAISSVWGEVISTGNIQAGKTIKKEYNFVLKNEWNAKHCSVVAFIYDDATKEIIQVEEQNKFYILF